MRSLGIQVLADYPPCSQDLNAIENAWALLRDRLHASRPTEVEDRGAFTARLRNAVRWMNVNKREQLVMFCDNQKEGARDVLQLKGGRTAW